MLRFFVSLATLAGDMIAANRDSKIVGGFEISLKDAPFIVSVQEGGSHICGGTILTLSHVLTGCHCLAYLFIGTSHRSASMTSPGRLTVVAGTENISNHSDSEQRREVRETKIHPNCTYEKYLLYDYGVIYLSEPLIQSDRVRPFTLASNDRDVYETLSRELIGDTKAYCYVAGWGSTESKPPEGYHQPSTIIKAVRVYLIPDTECASYLGAKNRKFNNYSFAENGLTCSLAHALRKNESDCSGDSGGPFFCGSQVYATVSFGFECGAWDVPSVYAKVSYAIDWLNELGLEKPMNKPLTYAPLVRKASTDTLVKSAAVRVQQLHNRITMLIYTASHLLRQVTENDVFSRRRYF